MNIRINQLVQSIFHKDSLDHCSVQELQQYADQNPYFGAAQLLLAKKMKAENHQQYNEQLQKTFLYFHNPMWVEQLISEGGQATVTPNAIQQKPEPVIVSVPEPVMASVPEPEPPAVTLTPEPVPEETSAGLSNTEVNEPVQPALNNPAFDSVQPASGDLVFEPYYTVDYFASQGIRLKEEEKPKDRFGQQLKSFTEWLKTMKKLPAGREAAGSVTAGEEKVEQLAEHSLATGDVVTEAMAEVWEKQGNTLKAIEIYQKLSLLEPAKSTYFAARIEELKKEVK